MVLVPQPIGEYKEEKDPNRKLAKNEGRDSEWVEKSSSQKGAQEEWAHVVTLDHQ